MDEFLVCLPYRPDVLCIFETRIADVPSINISIPEYNFFYVNSPTIVGGVGLYVLQDLKCEIIKEFSINVDGVDELWAEISSKESHSNIKRLICCAYRHPSQKNSEYFFNNLNNCLLNVKFFTSSAISIINTLCDSRQLNFSKMYKLILKSNDCCLIINKPTRLTKRSKTSIDHIVANSSPQTVFRASTLLRFCKIFRKCIFLHCISLAADSACGALLLAVQRLSTAMTTVM